MGKHTAIISNVWQRALGYRFTMYTYRIGELGETLLLVVMWTALFADRSIINGYTLKEMITYVLVGNLIGFITRNFLSELIAQEIKNGTLSIFLVKPISYFRYVLTREVGRVTLPFLMSLVSQLAIMLFFIDRLLFNKNLLTLGMMSIIIVLAFVIELLLGYLVGLIAFWTDEVDGLYTTISRLKKFFSGGYFPLAILPTSYLTISYALPFAYSLFVPTQLYLGKISLISAWKGIGVQCLWIVVLYAIIMLVWRRGIRKYEGVGI